MTFITTITLGIGSLMFCSIVAANCPNSLETQQLIECITIEGSGTNYQAWKADMDRKLAENTPPPKESESTISQTVPGVDATTVAPSAGLANKQ